MSSDYKDLIKILEQNLVDYESSVVESLGNKNEFVETLENEIKIIESKINDSLEVLNTKSSSKYNYYFMKFAKIKIAFLTSEGNKEEADVWQELVNKRELNDEELYENNFETNTGSKIQIQHLLNNLAESSSQFFSVNSDEYKNFESEVKRLIEKQNDIIKEVNQLFALKDKHKHLDTAILNKINVLIEAKKKIRFLNENEKRLETENLEKFEITFFELLEWNDEAFDKYYKSFILFVKESNDIKSILFKGVSKEDSDEIRKQFNKLRLIFHPDKARHLDPIISNEFFYLIEQCYKEILSNSTSLYKNEDMERHEKHANEHYQIAIELQNFLKNPSRNDFKYLSVDEMRDVSCDQIKKYLQTYALSAFNYYKLACKIADKLVDLEKKMTYRKNMSICLYLAEALLEAQMVNISLYFLIENVPGYSNEHEADIRQFINTINAKIREKFLNFNKSKSTDQKENVIPSSSSQDNDHQINEMQLVCAAGTSLMELADASGDVTNKSLSIRQIKEQKQRVKQETASLSMVLLNRQSLSLQEQIEKIYSTKALTLKQAKTKAILAPVLAVGFSGLGALSVYSEYIVISKTGLAFGVVGLLISSVLVAGYFMIKGAKIARELWEKYDSCSRLNDILVQSVELYGQENYIGFLEKLSETYFNREKKSLIKMIKENNVIKDIIINGVDIIDQLLYLDATSDCILNVLNLIATVLISGKIKIVQMPFSKLQAKADDLFKEIYWNKNLEQRAKELDQQISEWIRDKLATPFKNKFRHFFRENDSPYEKVSYQERLHEMKLTAKINLTILSLTMDFGQDGVEAAKSHMREIEDMIASSKYSLQHQIIIRLELLQDFFWIITNQYFDAYRNGASTIQPENIKSGQEPEADLLSHRFRSELDDYFESQIQNTSKLSEKLILIEKKGTLFFKNAEKMDVFDLDRFVQYKKALKEFERYFCLDKTNESIYVFILKCHLKMNQFEDGIRFIQIFLKSNFYAQLNLDKNDKLWLYMSRIYRKSNDLIKAELAISESIKSKKTDEALIEQKIIKNLKTKPRDIKFYKTSKFDSTFKTCNLKTQKYKIVSIDGGGIRGIIPAMLLSEIEHRARMPLSSMVNLFAGTSTGAILSAGLAIQTSDSKASNLLDIYCSKAQELFTINQKNHLFGSNYYKYEDTGRINIFKRILGEKKFTDLSNDLLITSVKYQTHRLKPFNKTNTPFVSLFDAVMSSTSAPTYFQPYTFNQETYLDGGILANNPSRLAFDYAANELGVRKENIFCLSLGTGDYMNCRSLDAWQSNTLLYWGSQIINDISIEAQGREVHRSMRTLIGDNYFRWQMYLDKPLALDDFNSIEKLMNIGKQFIEENDDSINHIVKLFKND